MEKKELSYGTLGPSLTAYGKDRNFSPDAVKAAFTKIYDSQAVFACSNMPRFGANKVLSEKQITDLVAFLLDPESPVNK
jgi:sulfur-oxidizing protein SoxX